VRLAICTRRRRLVRQLLTESFVWTLAGALAGVALASWGGSALVALMQTTEDTIVLDTAMSWRMLAVSTGLAVLTAAACAVIPALRATVADPALGLKSAGDMASAFGRRWSLGKGLVAAQVALAVLLLVGATLFVRSLYRVL